MKVKASSKILRNAIYIIVNNSANGISGCFFRQDVAYQMRTKTKEECEGHYMKNFINNPLFSSTLLSLRQMEDHLSRTADTAIPFKRKWAPETSYCSVHSTLNIYSGMWKFENPFQNLWKCE